MSSKNSNDLSKLSKAQLIKMIKNQKPKAQKKKPLNTIEFKGKTIKYTNIYDLRKKLGKNITLAEAKQYREDYNKKNTERIVVNKSGDIGKFDLTKKPLLLQKFGVMKTTTKQLLTTRKVKDVSIVNSISNLDVNLEIVVNFGFDVSDESVISRTARFMVKVNPKKINDTYVQNLVLNDYLQQIPDYVVNSLRLINYKISSQFTDQKFDLTNGKLREVKPLSLGNMYNEVIHNDKWFDCVRDMLKDRYNISKKNIDKLGNQEGVSTNEIYQFCFDYNIKMIAYDIQGNVIKSYYPTKKTHRAALIYIAYNNHLYLLKHQYLNKVKVIHKQVKFVENGNKKFIEFLEKGILPVKPIVFTDEIVSFIVDETKYICNSDYNKCLEILKKFGLEDKIFDGIKINKIGGIIEKLYCGKNNCNSFFPYSNRFRKGGYTYINEDVDYNISEVQTIDKNKCYPYCLSKLGNLLFTDIKTCEWVKGEQELKENWLYIVKPEESSILIPDSNLYHGEHLIKCKNEGVKFTILEGLECNSIDNYYTQMISDLKDKLSNEDFKEIMNILIGKMESDKLHTKTKEFIKICNNEEADTISGWKCQLNKNYQMIFKEKDSFNIYNKKPISVQIKDYSRWILYEKMKELGLSSDDVIQIKTDAISFKKKTNILDYLDSNNFNAWKEIKFSKMSQAQSFLNDNISFKVIFDNIDNLIGDCYAGCGKTHYIINKILPEVNNFIVLTPSHDTLEDYRKLKYVNCNCIQKYELSNTVPTEDIIIVDEVGMCSKGSLDVLFKCYLLGKNIFAFGDFKQMLPVAENKENGKQLNSELFIDLIFNNKKEMTKNYRNDFTKEYYDSLINEKVNFFKEVKKNSTKSYEDCDLVICYRNSTVDKYNDLICEKLGITSKFEKGVKLICKTNKLKDKEVYNNFVLTVIDNDNEGVKLSNGYVFSEEEIEKNFKYAYAKTIYGVQGSSIPKIYYAPEDYKFLNGRSAYTVISRIKTK